MMTCEDLVDTNFSIEPAALPLLQVNENTELLMQFRDNILGVLNHMTTMGGVMVRLWQCTTPGTRNLHAMGLACLQA